MKSEKGEFSYYFILKNKSEKFSQVIFRARSKHMDDRVQILVNQKVRPEKFTPDEMPKARRDVLTAFEKVFNSYGVEEMRPAKEVKQHVNEILNPQIAVIQQNQRYKALQSQKIPLNEMVRKAIANPLTRIKDTRGQSKAPTTGTIKNWKSLANNLEWFHRDTLYSLNPEMIDEQWLNHFVNWLMIPHEITHNDRIRHSEGLNEGTTWKYIKDIKKFLKIAELECDKETRERIYNILPDYQGFKIDHGYENRDNIPLYLSIDELKKIQSANLTNYPGLSKTRDWLIIACLTGQRHSDWHKIKPDNVKFVNGEERIIITQEKTGTQVKIPINPTIRKIWSKYPDGMTLDVEQVTNRKLKQLCKLAGINEVLHRDIQGNKVLKWQKASTHIGRRSLCTNMYDDKVPILLIMEISGHKTETEFMKYIRMSDDDKQRELGKAEFFTRAL